MLPWLTTIIDSSKLGGWVRAGVSSLLTLFAVKYLGDTFLKDVLSPALIDTVSVAASTIVVGWWSNLTKTPTEIVKRAEEMPQVKAITVTAASGIADPAVTGPKVTSAPSAK